MLPCFLLTFSLFLLVSSRPNLLPFPNNITYGTSQLSFSPCSVRFLFSSPQDALPHYYFDLLDFYYLKTFSRVTCHFQRTQGNNYQSINEPEYFNLNITITQAEPNQLNYPNSSTDEGYSLSLDWNSWSMQAQNYFGFLRGMETFTQLFETMSDKPFYVLKGLPLKIAIDRPGMGYRGIMIDTARHFIKVETLKHVLDGMLFHKLNVLHWHITDEEAFPLHLKSKPIITQYGAYSLAEVYSKSDIKEVIDYARFRGIRVIPEVDSPAHSMSWGFSPEYSDIALKCPIWSQYNGQLDPTLEKTYEVVQSILADLEEYFADEYLHLGGDEVNFACWESKPWIIDFMSAHNISNGVELQQYYHNKETAMLDSTRSAIFWMNDNKFSYRANDILQYWGDRTQYGILQNYTNKVIFSNYDYFYLDLGYGNVFGDQSWAPFRTWKDVYSFDFGSTKVDSSRILGAECPLWAELNSDQTMDNHLWARASVFAERVWNTEINLAMGPPELRDIVGRAYADELRMNERGFLVSPLTSEYCNLHLDVCFPDSV